MSGPVDYPLPPTGPRYIALEIYMAKGTRTRHFWVQEFPARLEQPRTFRGFIKFDGFRHRGITTPDLQAIMQFRIQCEVEAQELEKDGWAQVDPPSTRARRTPEALRTAAGTQAPRRTADTGPRRM